jgi:predicted metal-dependent hydrolase
MSAARKLQLADRGVTVELEEPFNYSVRFQRRKTIALHVLSDGSFEIRAPVGYRRDWIVEFARTRAEWAVGARERVRERQCWRVPPVDGGSSWLLGETLTVAVEAALHNAVEREGDLLRVHLRDPARLEPTLRVWYRREAERIFSERLAYCSARFPHPIEIPPLKLRQMRRRWGSCSRFGVITLNVDLVRLPVELIDYVVMHELCHLFEFNHSPRFYRLQALAVPEWREREAWLKRF